MHASNWFLFFSSALKQSEIRFPDWIVTIRKKNSETPKICFSASVLYCFVLIVFVTEGTSSTERVREAGHASRRRERLQRMEDEGVVPPRRRGARGRLVDVEHQP